MEERNFDADVAHVMSIVVDSMYQDKEIFLRELISNASDALDKREVADLTDPREDPYDINLVPDPEAGTLSVSDTGVGMELEDMASLLGTVAQSGTRAFADRLKSGSVIGKFGVGFYSAFLVADRVTVRSRTGRGRPLGAWESDGGATYRVWHPDEDLIPNGGTVVTLHLKPDCAEYLNQRRLRDVVARHSQFVRHRIYMRVVEMRKVPGKDEQRAMQQWEVLNRIAPTWDGADVSEEHHARFFQAVRRGRGGDYLARTSFSVEGSFAFKAAVYVPEDPPFDLFAAEANRVPRNVRLYCRGVFVTDECPEVCPAWLSFLEAAVCADDLELHAGRSTIQQRDLFRTIQAQLVRHAVKLLEGSPDAVERYAKEIKLGAHDDEVHRERLAGLLRWPSLQHPEGIGLADMDQLYVLTGPEAEDSPFLERFRAEGVDVLLMTDPMDEYLLLVLTSFQGKPVHCVSRRGVPVPWEAQPEMRGFCDWAAAELKTAVEAVEVTQSLVDTPCVVSTRAWGHSANMQRLSNAQAMSKQESLAKRVFEVNPASPCIQGVAGSRDPAALRVLFDTACLASGFVPDRPQAFCREVFGMVASQQK